MPMIIVDAHVHIHDCFEIERFFNAAYSNFQSEADQQGYGDELTPFLLLTETERDGWFDRLRQFADEKNTYKDLSIKKWEFHHTGESVSLSARSGHKNLVIIAGRQIEAAEGLEVLALSTIESFKSGIPVIKLIEEVKKHDGIPVIPWGFGKWLGRRGGILNDLIKIHKDLKFYLGDNSGRSSFLPYPHHFKIAKRNGIHILPGSDPLPFPTECHRVGSFGFLLEERISKDYPATGLKKILMRPKLRIQSYGDFENPFRFFRNQIKMQIKKRYSKFRA